MSSLPWPASSSGGTRKTPPGWSCLACSWGWQWAQSTSRWLAWPSLDWLSSGGFAAARRMTIVKAALAFGVPALMLALPWVPQEPVVVQQSDLSALHRRPRLERAPAGVVHGLPEYLRDGEGPAGAALPPMECVRQSRSIRHDHELDRLPKRPVPAPVHLPTPAVAQRAVSILLLVSLARIGVWFVGSQQLRFLLPVAPALAVAAGYVVVQLSELQHNRRMPLHQFFPSLAVALLAVTLTYQLIMLRQFRSVQVVVGAESRVAFSPGWSRTSPSVTPPESSCLSAHVYYKSATGAATTVGHRASQIPTIFAGRTRSRLLDVPCPGEIRERTGSHPRSAQHRGLGLPAPARSGRRDSVHPRETGSLASDQGCLRQVFQDEWNSLYEISCPPS